MNGGTTGAARSQSKATGELWTESQTLKNPGAQSPDLCDLLALCFVSVTLRRSVHKFLWRLSRSHLSFVKKGEQRFLKLNYA